MVQGDMQRYIPTWHIKQGHKLLWTKQPTWCIATCRDTNSTITWQYDITYCEASHYVHITHDIMCNIKHRIMFITTHTYLVFLWKIRNINLMNSNSVIDCSQIPVMISKDHIHWRIQGKAFGATAPPTQSEIGENLQLSCHWTKSKKLCYRNIAFKLRRKAR